MIPSQLSNHVCLPEPALSFHPSRVTDRDIHPLRGLLKYGPYSKSLLLPDPIRVATIAPVGEAGKLYEFMKELNSSYTPQERQEYLPEWPGFQRVFGARMAGAGQGCHIEIEAHIEQHLQSSSTPHVVLAETLVRAITQIDARRHSFDVLFVYLPNRWAPGFSGGAEEDFDLHDHLKALTAARGLPLQIVREDSALKYRDRASVMWRIGLALYAKAGGIPWKIADSNPDTAYIGISYSIRPVVDGLPRFVTCCSQVFDSDGAGLEFVAYDTSEFELQRENPFLSRGEMFKVMSRAMDLYRRKHAGRVPRRVMVHKTTEFKLEEVDGCMEAFDLCEAVDLIQIVESVGWRGVLIDAPQGDKAAEAARFPVSRGTLLGISPREALLWTHGSVSGIGPRTYFQGKKGTPQPLRLIRHAGHGSWDDSAMAILALSKMDWNNDALYDPLPVTLGYAKVLSRVVKRMNQFGSIPYQFRFFM